jgi:hypothetical protein
MADIWYTVRVVQNKQQDGAGYLRDRNTYTTELTLEDALTRMGETELRAFLKRELDRVVATKAQR